MRPKLTMRRARSLQVAAGALMLAVPGSAVALAAGQADAQSVIQINLSPRHVAFGKAISVTGDGSSTAAGQPVELEYAPRSGAAWQPLKGTQAGPDGRFHFRLRPRRSGLLRAVVGGTPARAASDATVSAGAPAISQPQPLAVGSRFDLPRHPRVALGGQIIHVAGQLLPGQAGRRVSLITHRGAGWRMLATARTGARGGFDLRYRAPGSGGQWLRVMFAGDRANTGTSAVAGLLSVFRPSVASWYDDGGATACGFHAGYGVANKDLPCGTRVSFHYGGRSVTAVVDDRGPYVGGREWDLNQNTAAALGFDGVGTVWSSL